MTKPKDDLSVEYVRSALDYDPGTGALRWKHRSDKAPQWNGKFFGRVAGYINDRGYVIVAINAKDYRAHRLIWVIMTGEWPEDEIDHEDMIKSHNQWSNLRAATHVQNNQNKPAQSNNTSGFKGVSFCKASEKYVARAWINGKYPVLGRTDTPEAAAALYRRAVEQHRGEFANSDGRR